MAENGKCNVDTMSGTIVYTVDKSKLKHNDYLLQVLTVVTTTKVTDNNLKCSIDTAEGSAGHVLLSYKSGGSILTSMGHWAELM